MTERPTADHDAQRREHEAFVAECETKGVCWASGLRIASCMASICDCFRETHPDSPYDLHPEDFIVGRVIPPASGRSDGGDAGPQSLDPAEADAIAEAVIEWLAVPPAFGAAMPHGSCNASVNGTVCGFPRRADGSCINGHPSQPERTEP